jgi:hypothetical protein
MNINWPYQSTPYLSALPGVGGPGLDVSKGDKPSKLYFVTSTENKKEGGPDPRGPNCFSGTLWWCWYADQGEGFSKWIIPLVSGYTFLGRGLLTPIRENFDYIGHAAPGAGLFVQTCTPCVRASNSRVWHMPSWVGDLPSVDGPDKYKADQRDALQCSTSDEDTNRIAFINCEARFAMDESVQCWYDSKGISWIRGAIFDPLHCPPDFVIDDDHHGEGIDHGYGQIISGRADYSLAMQSLYAHTTDRNPLVSAPNHAHINNLHYNHGRMPPGTGAGVKIDDNGEYNETAGLTMQFNMAGCISVRGPDQGDRIVFVEVQDVTEGSSAHMANNSVYGWPAQSPEDFVKFNGSNTNYADYMKPTLRPGAWPLGLGFSDYDGTVKPCADPMHPTVQEGLAFAQLIRTTVGCMPARRYLYTGGVNKVMDQIDAAIRGVPFNGSQYVNTVDEAGGWPDVPTGSIDPLNPTSDYHAPLPVDASRDEYLTSGTFSDGSSKVGYTRLRAWCIEQYFYVMGR